MTLCDILCSNKQMSILSSTPWRATGTVLYLEARAPAHALFARPRPGWCYES